MLTDKQETFAQEVALGHSLTDAYQKAYPTTKKRETCTKKGSALLRNEKVRERILELRKEAIDMSPDDPTTMRAFIIQQYKEIASCRLQKEKRIYDAEGNLIQIIKELNPSDVVNALRALAEIYGIDMQQKDNKIEVVLEADMEEWTG